MKCKVRQDLVECDLQVPLFDPVEKKYIFISEGVYDYQWTGDFFQIFIDKWYNAVSIDFEFLD